ncbi:MAG TPA: hypothetical protein VLJ68_02610 [Chitinophagaceae bacterium]|nr:hypothetical protein [Chitinophagaceae bacterium]
MIQIADAVIWIRNKRAFCIGDIEGANENNFGAIIDGLKKLAAKLGRKQLQFHGSPGTHLHQLFSSRFPSKPSFPSLFQDFGSEIAPEKIKFTYADLDTF